MRQGAARGTWRPRAERHAPAADGRAGGFVYYLEPRSRYESHQHQPRIERSPSRGTCIESNPLHVNQRVIVTLPRADRSKATVRSAT